MGKSKQLFCIQDISFILGKDRFSFKKGNVIDDVDSDLYDHLKGSVYFVDASDEVAICKAFSATKENPILQIGVMRNGGYGDILLGTAIVKGIRRKYPNAFITWFTTPQFVHLLRKFPYVNHVKVINHYLGEYDYYRTHRYNFDMFFCIKPDAEIWYTNKKLSERFPELLKYDKIRNLVNCSEKQTSYDWIKKQNKWWVDIYKKLIGVEFTEDDMWYDLVPHYDVRCDSAKYAVISSDGAGGTQVKSIPVTTLIKVTEHLKKLNYKVYQVGDSFTNKVPNAISLVGKTSLSQAVGFVKNCDLYVGCDGFLTHIASHYNVKSVCVYGPTPPKIWGHKNLNIVYANYKCKLKPCWDNKRIWHNSCFINGRLQGECMIKLKPSTITNKIDEVIQNDITAKINKRT